MYGGKNTRNQSIESSTVAMRRTSNFVNNMIVSGVIAIERHALVLDVDTEREVDGEGVG